MTVRILHVCQPTDGGAAAVVRDLVRAGVLAGDEVSVACPAGGYLADWVVDAGARWIDVEMTRSPSWRDALATRRVRRLLPDADVVHLHSSKAGAVGRLAARTMGSARPRILFTPHGWSWYVGTRLSTAFRVFERWASRVSDVITVVSTEELRAGREVLGPRPCIELVENGVDAAAFSPDGPVAAREASPLVVQVGRLSVEKGQDRSLRALAACAHASVRLRLVGDGPDGASLRALAATLGVGDRVEFVGTVDPRPHLRAADVVVLPSRWEGMSLVMLEAMSVGAAVVSSDCGGSDALIGAGLLIEHADDQRSVAQLHHQVSQLLSSDAERTMLGRRARRRIEERYLLTRTVERYRQLWESR